MTVCNPHFIRPFCHQPVAWTLLLATCLAAFGKSLRAAESPEFLVTVDSRVTIDTVTMADSVGSGFKAHLNFPYMHHRHDGSLSVIYTGGQTQSGLQFGKQAISNSDGTTWATSTSIASGSQGQAQIIKPPGQYSLGFSVGINSGAPINSWANSSYSSNNGGISWFEGVSNYHTGSDTYMTLGGSYGSVVEIDNTLYMPVFGKRPDSSTFESMLMVSTNEGVNWTKRSTISPFVPGPNLSMGSEGSSETTLLGLDNGDLLAVFRTGQPFPNTNVDATEPSLFFLHSTDRGNSWTTPKMLGVGGVFPLLRKLDDGSVALTYGRYGGKVMFADPTGKRWTTPEVIYDGPGSGHTEMRRRNDGKYVFVYDQSGFYPPPWNNSVPSGYVFDNDQSAHLMAAVLDIQNVPVVDPFDWDLEYHGDVAPDVMGAGLAATSSGAVSGFLWADRGQDYFRIDTDDSGGNNRLYYTLADGSPNSAWADVDFADGLVLETGLRTGSFGVGDGAASLFLDDGQNGSVSLELTGGSVILSGLGGSGSQVEYSSTTNPDFSTQDFHDYRLVIEPDPDQGNTITAQLFLDGDFSAPILTQFLQASFFDELRFGDSDTFNNGVMDINYLRFASLASGIEGDFNGDGVVDAADYTTYRDNLGAAENGIVLGGNGSGGIVDQADYLLWKASFGGAAIGAVAAVPEPTAVLLQLSGMLFLACLWARPLR